MRRLPDALITICVSLAACTAEAETPKPAPDAVARKARLIKVARSKNLPVYLTAAPGDTSGRLFLVEKLGTIRLLRDGKLEDTPFLDISDLVSGASEQGLLGLAFHPGYAKNGRFYLNYTDRRGDTRVVEYRVSGASPDLADEATARELLFVDQPYANHNGGHLLFGPDGKLYVGLGDGGAANDPHGNGQNPRALLGKMLRLDVDAEAPRPEIVQSGLRNPWRYAFDPKTGDFFIADVGQNEWEEVDVVGPAQIDGANFGWNVLEGTRCFRTKKCDKSKYVAPVVEYDHRAGCSITGGMVYRGRALPDLDGIYFYADYCTGLLRGFRWKGGKVADHWDWKRALDPDFKLATVSSFGIDSDGELYILSLDGNIWKLVPATP